LPIDHGLIFNYALFISCKTGVFAIAKPCSIVVNLKELFGSESKSQVYGHLHELLEQPEMSNKGMFRTRIEIIVFLVTT